MTAHVFFCSRFLHAHAWPALFGVLLSGCSTLGSVGADTFTLEGELPADFALKAQAHYRRSENCSGRGHVKSFKEDYEKVPHGYQFKIPVSYQDGLCNLQLVRVGLFIHGRYGEKDWQQTYDNGQLLVATKQITEGSNSTSSPPSSLYSECSWLFQESKLNLEISKILSCKGAEIRLNRKFLPEQTVILSFTVNPREEPYRDNTWKESPEGWRPCLPKEGWQQCQDPPVFGTFKMDGRKCTVYPNCKE